MSIFDRLRQFKDLTAFDIETTGLSAQHDQIIQASFVNREAFEVNVLEPRFDQNLSRFAQKTFRRMGAVGITSEDRTLAELTPAQRQVFTKRGFLGDVESYRRTTADPEKARRLIRFKLNQILAKTNNPIIIHNANFERQFLKASGINLPIEGQYFDILDEAREEAQALNARYLKDLAAAPASQQNQITKNYLEQRFQSQLNRSLQKYDYFVDVLKNQRKAVIDTQAAATSAVGLLQQRGLVRKTGDIFTGTSLEVLGQALSPKSAKELHLAAADAWLSKEVAPQIFDLVDKLRTVDPAVLDDPRGKARFLRTLTPGQRRYIKKLEGEQLALKINAVERQFQTGLEKIARFGEAEFERGTRVVRTQEELVDYFRSRGSKFFQGTTYAQAYKGFNVQNTISNIIKKAPLQGKAGTTLSTNKGLGALRKLPSAIVPLGGLALLSGAFLSNLFSGKDDDYNTIEGLRHGWFGSQRNDNTDFGSGFKFASNYSKLETFAEKYQDPETKAEIKADIKEKQARAQEQLGSLNRTELMRINDLNTLEAINSNRRALREVKLSDYDLLVDDADTLVLKKKGTSDKPIVIRMAGIDAPETTHDLIDDPMADYRINQLQPGGLKATERLQELIDESDDLRLLVDPTQQTYGRYLGVLLNNQENLQLRMVEEGRVSSLEFGSTSKDLVDRSRFSAAGQAAEQAGVGIWSDPFYKRWLEFSAGYGRDLTFNSLTDITRLAENKALGLAAGMAWGDIDESEYDTYSLGKLASNRGFRFSSVENQNNKIEALRHGWFGNQRRDNTLFGSGFRAEELHQRAVDDPIENNYFGLLLTAGAFGLGASVWNRPFEFAGRTVPVSSLNYLGLGDQLSGFGRTTATYGDIAYNAIRRMEYSLAGIPKTFSVSAMMSPYILRDATYKIPIGEAPEYAKYLDDLTGRQLIKEGFSEVVFQKGKLYGTKGQKQQVLLDHARLVQRVHDPAISQAPSQFAESLIRMRGIDDSVRRGLPVSPSTEKFPFLVAGAQTRAKANIDMLHAFAHESLSKYLRLLDDPAKFAKDLFSVSPDAKIAGEQVFKMIPKLGVSGEAGLVGSVPQLLGRHARTFLPKAVLLPFAFGMANWAIRGLSPEGTIGDEAGIPGVLAEGVKTAHLTAARVSEYSGLTDLRQSVEEQAPGTTGVFPFLGLSLSMGLTGGFLGAGQNVFEEVLSKNKYDTLVKNIGEANKQHMPQSLRGIPGFKGAYTRAGRYARFGAVAGGLLGLPFLLSGLGSDKSVAELEAEYSGQKEVAVYKGRWWEMGQTPFKGENISYFRPNWYQRIKSNFREKTIYEGDNNLSPVSKLIRDFTDPYYLEKLHYDTRPYPITGPSGEALGIFGPLYEWTVGRVLKPPKLMHTDQYGGGPVPSELGLEPSAELGGLPGPDPISPYSAQQQLQQQWYASYEALGLRGFVASAALKAFKGEKELFTDRPILESAADIGSARRAFWDMNLGGGFGLTESMRRIIPRRTSDFEYVNPIANAMPDWLPGDDYFINFRQGDIYARIPEGEYRLPGAGYATRFEDLEGVNPEDYPLEHRYKILADVAMYSDEFTKAQQRMQALYRQNKLSEEAAIIFEQTEEQVKLKKQKKEFRQENDSILSTYYSALTDVAKMNPLEHLTPLSPAHKFMPPLDPLDSYREMVYTRQFKLWEHPVEHFIKPTIQLSAHLAGWEGIPDDVEQRREVEEHFDRLQYIKSQKLKELARERGDRDLFRKARDMETGTIMGVNPYSYPSRIIRALPDRERPYFLEFVDAPEDEKQQILTLAPENLRDIYLAQWDKRLEQQIKNGEIQGSQKDLDKLREDIKSRRRLMRLKRQSEAEEFANSENLPPDDWIGWRSDVDLQDVKLKYLLDQGEDYHYYDLWENRLRTLGRKPYLDDAVQYVRIPDRKTNYQNLYDFAAEAGIQDADIQITTGSIDNVQLEIDHDRSGDIDKLLKAGGHIL